MGDFGWHSGYVEALNLQSGSVSFAATEETVTVTFDKSMRQVPAVVLTNNADTDVWNDTVAADKFTVRRASTGSAETVRWIAFDDNEAYRS